MQAEEAKVGMRVTADAGFESWEWQSQQGNIIEVVDASLARVEFDQAICGKRMWLISLVYLRGTSPEHQEQQRRKEHAMKHF